MFAIALAVVASGGISYVFLLAIPSLVWSQMGYWEFLWLQHFVLIAASLSASLCAPLGGDPRRSDRDHRGPPGPSCASDAEAGRRLAAG
jgi:hypothetical protein